MIEERYIELMNREIDGLISSAEREELHAFIERTPEARHYYDELKGVTDLLAKADQFDPPVELKRDILASLPSKELRRRIPFFAALRMNIKPKYAYTFAVGIIAGIILYAVFNQFATGGTSLDIDNLYGTVAFDSGGQTPVRSIPIKIDLHDVTGEALINYFDEAVVAHIKLNSKREVNVHIKTPQSLSFELFKTLVSTDHNFQTENSELTVTSRGISDFIIVFKDDTESHAALQLKIASGKELLFEKAIQPGRN